MGIRQNRNKRILVTQIDKPYEATAVGIDEIGRLIVEKDTGEIVRLNAGEVRILIHN